MLPCCERHCSGQTGRKLFPKLFWLVSTKLSGFEIIPLVYLVGILFLLNIFSSRDVDEMSTFLFQLFQAVQFLPFWKYLCRNKSRVRAGIVFYRLFHLED